jgi:hypothetical protein
MPIGWLDPRSGNHGRPYPRARTEAIEETGLLDLPQLSPLTVEQTLDDPLADDFR